MDNHSYPDIPAELHPALEKALERIEHHEGWAAIIRRDARIAAMLHKVLACSEYAADVLARYPEVLADLIFDGRMHRPLESGELELISLAARLTTKPKNSL